MNRQSVAKTQNPKILVLHPPADILQRKTINRTDFGASTVNTLSPSGQLIDKPGLPGVESHFIQDFSKIPVTLNSPYPIQAKLKIGQPDDKCEQEADRVAEQVMRMPDPQTRETEQVSAKSQTSQIQRTCDECEEVEEDEELIKTKKAGDVTPEVTPAISSGIQSLQGGGRPLSGSKRGFFEPRFGADFSNVRVHNDTRAASAARSINARAFTLGHNVVFGAGEYYSDALAGRKLLAHELTHVVQQNGGPTLFSEGKDSENTIPNSQEFSVVSPEFGEQEDGMIQRQEQPDVTGTEDISPDPEESSATRPEGGSTRANRCYTNPEFPDFRCLASALKLDIDENLWNNAHHFYRAASLFPDDNELMWNTFLRYGLGVNLLQTSFGFLGTNERLGTVLSYGTGIGLKSYDLFQNGVLKLDVPIPLGRGVNLDLQLDLNADPNNLTNVRKASVGVGFSGHF